MQYLNRAMHEKGYQESSVDKAQRLSCEDLINHHHLVIFRCDDSADHHKAVWYSGTTTQPTTTSKTVLDLSGAMTQPADHNVQRNSALKEIRLNISYKNEGRSNQLKSTALAAARRTQQKPLPKAAKEQKNYGSTITKTHEHCNNFALLKSADSSLQTNPSYSESQSPANPDLIAKAEVPQIWPQLSLTSDYAISDLTLHAKHTLYSKRCRTT
ncbi:hypothetical protein F511_30005 [Dorcoceras hygrometricum]|uniref:Uncharacterized protein n=1 Tax=Dorcoceras hygrometricum TaxID=472368 RepID=A0A2Z7CJU9_9LAMI|nr:hypothetical protein F511_30005 [Dorcoceras hygrometricum]